MKLKNKKRGRPRKGEQPELRVVNAKTQLGAKVRHKMFREEYFANNFNATKAYMEVFGCDHETAIQNSPKLLKDTKMLTNIDRRITKMFTKLEIKSEHVLAELVKMAFVDIRGFFNDGVFIGIENLNIAQQSCVESVEMDALYEKNKKGKKVLVGEKQRIKFYSRQKAIDSLMKFLGMVKEPKNISQNFFVDNRKVEVISAAKELKEKLGDSGVAKLNKLLTKAKTDS